MFDRRPRQAVDPPGGGVDGPAVAVRAWIWARLLEILINRKRYELLSGSAARTDSMWRIARSLNRRARSSRPAVEGLLRERGEGPGGRDAGKPARREARPRALPPSRAPCSRDDSASRGRFSRSSTCRAGGRPRRGWPGTGAIGELPPEGLQARPPPARTRTPPRSSGRWPEAGRRCWSGSRPVARGSRAGRAVRPPAPRRVAGPRGTPAPHSTGRPAVCSRSPRFAWWTASVRR